MMAAQTLAKITEMVSNCVILLRTQKFIILQSEDLVKGHLWQLS